MATVTAVLVPDYTNSVSVANSTGTIVSGAPGIGTTAALTFGKRRLLHIAALNVTGTANRGAVSYTLGLSTGTVAPAVTSSSPFFMGDEGFTIDLGDLYDQIILANDSTKNGNTVTLAYSISIMSKF